MGAASRAFSAGRKPPKHAPKGTLEGGQFIGRASITHALIRKLLGVGEDRQQGSAVGRFTSRGGSVASIALHPRRPRIDDRVRDPRTGKLGRVLTISPELDTRYVRPGETQVRAGQLHPVSARVKWDDGQEETRPLSELEDPYAQRLLPDPERTFHAERGPRPAQVDTALTQAPPGKIATQWGMATEGPLAPSQRGYLHKFNDAAPRSAAIYDSDKADTEELRARGLITVNARNGSAKITKRGQRELSTPGSSDPGPHRRTAAERMRDGIAAGKAIGRDRQRALDIAAGRKPRPTSAEIDDRIADAAGAPGAPDLAPKTVARKTGSAELSSDPAVRAVQIENKIRAALGAIRARPFTPDSNVDLRQSGWVRLADLRNELGESINRHELDDALKRLQDAVIIPESAQWLLRPEDRDAELIMGGQRKHWLKIEDLPPSSPPAKKATAAQRMSRAAKPKRPGIDEFNGQSRTQLLAHARREGVKVPPGAPAHEIDWLLTEHVIGSGKGMYANGMSPDPARRAIAERYAEGDHEGAIADLLAILRAKHDADVAALGLEVTPPPPPAAKKATAAAKMARGKAPSGPRPSGLPTNRKATATDFEDLAVRVSRLRTAEQRHAVFADLNATELNALARQFPGEPVRSRTGVTSDRRTVLKIPAGLSLEERRRWLAERLAAPQ